MNYTTFCTKTYWSLHTPFALRTIHNPLSLFDGDEDEHEDEFEFELNEEEESEIEEDSWQAKTQ